LEDVGECDLTADVNFSHIRAVADGMGIDATMSITQSEFLRNMGIETRLLMLMREAKSAKGLKS